MVLCMLALERKPWTHATCKGNMEADRKGKAVVKVDDIFQVADRREFCGLYTWSGCKGDGKELLSL